MKNPKGNNSDTKKEYRNKLNSRWIIGILVFIVLCLVSLIFCQKYLDIKLEIKFLEILATMLSIVLSFIAIFYSYSTSIESNRQWELISNAVTTIDVSLDSIKNLHKQMQNDLGNISSQMYTLDNSVNNFRQISMPKTGMPNNHVED